MTKKEEDMPQESLYAFPTMVGKDWGRGSMFTTPLDRGTRFPLTMTAQPIFSPATSEKKEEGTPAKGRKKKERNRLVVPDLKRVNATVNLLTKWELQGLAQINQGYR